VIRKYLWCFELQTHLPLLSLQVSDLLIFALKMYSPANFANFLGDTRLFSRFLSHFFVISSQSYSHWFFLLSRIYFEFVYKSSSSLNNISQNGFINSSHLRQWVQYIEYDRNWFITFQFNINQNITCCAGF
jgi:hypothetical protein